MTTAPNPSAPPSTSLAEPRHLRPGQLIPTPEGIWAVDAVQPVAAVLDATGQVRRIVSWPHLPPAPAGPERLVEKWPPAFPWLMCDGEAMWVQHHPGGPLARLDATAETAAQGSPNDTTAWVGAGSDEHRLAACTPGAAWCVPPPPEPETVGSPDAEVTGDLGPDHLVRVDRHGRVRHVRTDRPVSWVQADDEALHVRVLDAPWHLTPCGDSWQVTYTARWLRLPHDAPVPETLDLATYAVPAEQAPARQGLPGALRGSTWYDNARHRPLRSGAVQWTFGWSQDPTEQPAPQPTVIAVATTVATTVEDGDTTTGRERRLDLGPGRVTAAAPVAGDGLLLAIERRGWASGGIPKAPVEVVQLTPDGHRRVVLPAQSVDISAHCWPLVPRPAEADSYTAQVLQSWQSLDAYWHHADGVRPLAPGLSGTRVRLVGQWPLTHLECTFDVAARPGLRLRHRVPLFDELGRIAHPRYADVHLMETLETNGGPPPAGVAVDGVLDV